MYNIAVTLDPTDLSRRAAFQLFRPGNNILNNTLESDMCVLATQSASEFFRLWLSKMHLAAKYIQRQLGPRRFIVLTQFARDLPELLKRDSMILTEHAERAKANDVTKGIDSTVWCTRIIAISWLEKLGAVPIA